MDCLSVAAKYEVRSKLPAKYKPYEIIFTRLEYTYANKTTCDY